MQVDIGSWGTYEVSMSVLCRLPAGESDTQSCMLLFLSFRCFSELGFDFRRRLCPHFACLRARLEVSRFEPDASDTSRTTMLMF